jgi:hypothetical protein
VEGGGEGGEVVGLGVAAAAATARGGRHAVALLLLLAGRLKTTTGVTVSVYESKNGTRTMHKTQTTPTLNIPPRQHQVLFSD